MSTDATHIIACYRLELDFQGSEGASEVSDALMATSRQHAASLIDACCARLIPSDAYISISALELDLGELNPANLEADFLEKFQLALSAKLQAAFEERAAETPVQRALDLVQNYGETGQYPWWAGSPAPGLLHDAIGTLLNAPAAIAHRPFRDLLSRGQILQRLVFALPPAQLTAIWQALSAILPPVPAQATIHAATEAMLQQAGQVERQRWQDFAHQALLRTLPHQSTTATPAAFLSWYEAQGLQALPEQVLQRFSQRDAFVTTIIWLWESVGINGEALAFCMEELSASGSAAQALNIAESMVALRAWMQAHWRLSGDVLEQLVRGIVTTYRLGQGSVVNVGPTEEDLRLQWLRRAMDMPEAPYAALVTLLGIRFHQESNILQPAIDDIEGWLERQYHFPADVRRGVARDVAVSDHLRANYPEAPSHPKRNEGPSPEPFAQNPEQAAALTAQIPWLRQKLHLPTAALPELLAALRQRFVHENPNTEPEATAIETWLRATYPLASETRQLLSEAAALQSGHPGHSGQLSHRNAQRHPESLHHLETLQDPEEGEEELRSTSRGPLKKENADQLRSHRELLETKNSEQSSNQHNLPTMSSEGLDPKQPVQDPKKAAALAAQIPWLRQKLHLPTAALPELLEALRQRFASENPDTEPEATAIEAWLRATYPLAPETRQLLAEAAGHAELLNRPAHLRHPKNMGQSESPGNQVLLSHPETLPYPEEGEEELRSTSRGPLKKDGIEQLQHNHELLEAEGREQSGKQPNLLPEQTEGLDPTPYTQDPNKAAALAAQIPWLRKKLQLPTAALPALLEALRQRFSSENPNTEPEVIAIEAWLRATYPLAPETRQLLAEAVAIAAKATGREANSPLAARTREDGLELPAIQVEKPLPAISQPISVRRPTQFPDAPIFVDNAGLILFWPFLQKYFEYQGLVEGKQFVSVLAQMQAVRLLQNMVMPGVEWNEAALALPKLLCGLPPDAVVDPMVPISEEMEATAGVLIEVVTAHWTMLGNISEDGFRQAWLWRNGTLRIRDDHWLLRVETLAHDMLMEGLPWELGYILLPWMPHELYVDWGEKAKFNA